MPFVKGQSGNPAGKPKGAVNFFRREDFIQALEKVEKEKGKTLYQHAIERAFENDKILAVMVTRMVPEYKVRPEDDDELKEQEFVFVEVPHNGDGKDRFTKYLN